MGVLGIVNSMLLTRLLPPVEYAVYGKLITFSSAAVTLISFGYDLAYTRFEKARWGGKYMSEDNLKLVLGQVLLNRQRRGRIYVKYEKKQSCFHITCRL